MEDSLKVASDRKKEVIKTNTRTYEKNVQDVSRNLLSNQISFPFPVAVQISDPLTCVEQVNNLQKDKSGRKVAGNEHSINVACSKANWDEDDNSNDLETSDN